MMKRRWSNNGGFTALRMLEESSSEVTSSSNGLVLSSGVNMSPSSLDSRDYEQDLWMCGNDAMTYSGSGGGSISGTAAQLHNSVITMAMNAGNNNNNNNNHNGGGGNGNNCSSSLPSQTTIIPINSNGMNIIGQTVLNGGLHQNYGGGGGQGGVQGGTTLGGLHMNANGMNVTGGGGNHMQNGHNMIGSTTASAMHMHQNGVGLGGGMGVGGGGNGVGGGMGLPHLHTNGNGMQHTPRSDSANSISSGRDDLSPSSSLNGYSANEGCDAKKSKKGPAPRLQEELCLVCGDRASGYHYNALTCEGCKGFFRRSVTKNAVYVCKFGRACEMDMYMRRKCQECRLKKCLAVGMRPECVVPENQCAMKRREKKAQKEKDKITTSPSSHPGTPDYFKKEILDLMTCEPPQHPTCPLLPDDILAKCQARNIPPLTYNQLAVIYKLIWYQDGYEQPSEEDLKRIMSQPDENESQNDVSFRHITEITILTVQLIVEFAKGLPAFTKIPQEDQITLLKACSSEVMMLRMARRYDQNSDSIFFANNRSYTRDSYKIAGVADNIEDLLHFCRQMYSMKVDNVEYALLTAIVIFSDRPGLDEAQLVEAIQSYYIDTLRIYILNRHCGDPMSLVFYAKLLSILTELRTLGNQNAEMCFSLKLKNRKLPKFLEEIWDVHAIPPPVQSHLQAQEEEEQRLQQRLQQQQQQHASSSGGDADTGASVASTSAAAQAAAAQQGNSNNMNTNNNNNSNNNMCEIVVSGIGSPSSPPAMSSSSSASGGGSGGGGVGAGVGSVGVNVNVGSLSVGSGLGSGLGVGVGGGVGIGGVSSTMVGNTIALGHNNMMANNMSGIGNDFIGSVLGPTTAAATSSTTIAGSVPVSSTTAAAVAAANGGGVGVGGISATGGVGGVGVGGVNVCNAQTAFALLGMPLQQTDQLIGGTVVKSEHSTTA